MKNNKHLSHNLPPQPADDLQQIKGIGKAVAEALQRLGVTRFADLAGFTPESLADLLKAEIPSMNRQRIERQMWIEQARELSLPQVAGEEERAASQHVSLGESNQKPEWDGQGRSEPDAESWRQSEGNRTGWHEVADFFVSFGYVRNADGTETLQTKAHHSQLDQQVTWDGIAPTMLIEWMLSQANLAREAPVLDAEEDPGLPDNQGQYSDEEISLEIVDVWVSEVKMAGPVPGAGAPHHLRVEGEIVVNGPAAPLATQANVAYQVEVFLVDMATGTSSLASTAPGSLIPGELQYPIQQEFPVPRVGDYQVYIFARLLPPVGIATHVQGPVLHVEA